jgi:hypothetical protein
MFRTKLFILFLGFCALAQMPSQGADLRIVIVPEFAGWPLQLSTRQYISGQNDSLYIDLFRCYLSGFRLSANGQFTATDSTAHLVDASDSATMFFLVTNIPAGNYDHLVFNIGVDSLSNVSGAMGGDLDPVKGMYWAWNTGFINAKMEGRSNACKTLHHAFEFHIGGFAAPFNTLRTVSLALDSFTIPSNNTTVTIRLRADLAAWLSNIRLAETSSIVMPSTKAVSMSYNYTKMFGLIL